MPVQLYFPYGVPSDIQRIRDPDRITKALLDGVRELEVDLIPLSRKAREIIHGKRSWWSRIVNDRSVLDPEWLHWIVFDRGIRKSLSKDQRSALNFLARLAQLDPSGHRPVFPVGDPPTEKQIKQSILYLNKEIEGLMLKMHPMYISMLEKVGKEIASMCVEDFGEECDRDEATGIAHADLQRMAEIDRFPGLSPEISRLISAFLNILG